MARFIPDPNMDVNAASQWMLPAVRRALDNVQGEGKRFAPPAKTWITARDERVRPSHVHTDSQTIPGNLRYQVPKVNTGNDLGDVRAGHDLAREPRDPNLPIGNRIRCRCTSVELPRAVADSILKSPVTFVGTRVTGEVWTNFNRAAESEFGTTGDTAARFFGKAINAAAAKSPGFVARGT